MPGVSELVTNIYKYTSGHCNIDKNISWRSIVYLRIISELKHKTIDRQFHKWRKKNFHAPAEKDELEYIFTMWIIYNVAFDKLKGIADGVLEIPSKKRS